MSNRLNPNGKSVDEYLAEDAADEAGPAEAKKEKEAPKDPLEEIPEKFPGAPKTETLRGWKEVYKGLYAFVADKDSIYLFRSLKRLEHKAIMHDIRAVAESERGRADPQFVEDQHHERVVNLCLLHPPVKPQFFTESEAGLIPTLFNLMMENSKFISAEKALDSTYKL